MENMVQVDKRIARRLWNNNADLSFVPKKDLSQINCVVNRNFSENRDFDKRVNAVMYYWPCQVMFFAKQKDIDELQYSNLKLEEERDDARSKIENAKKVFLGNKKGNSCDAVVITEDNEILQYKASLKGDSVYVNFDYSLDKYTDSVRINDIVPLYKIEQEAVYALHNWTEDAVRRVKVKDIAKGEYEDYDTGKTFVDERLVLNLGQRISQRTLNTTDKCGIVICDDGETREVFCTKALMDKIDEFRDDGRIDGEVKSFLTGGIRDAEGRFRRTNIQSAFNLLIEDIEELAPHLKHDYLEFVKLCVYDSPSVKRVEEITDEVLKIAGVQCDTPMKKEMRDCLIDRVLEDMGKVSMYQLFDNALSDMWEDGKSNAPGGMVYTEQVNSFFENHEVEIAKVARYGYPNEEDPYFRGDANKLWAVNQVFNRFIEEVGVGIQDKKSEIDKIPLKRPKEVKTIMMEDSQQNWKRELTFL